MKPSSHDKGDNTNNAPNGYDIKENKINGDNNTETTKKQNREISYILLVFFVSIAIAVIIAAILTRKFDTLQTTKVTHLPNPFKSTENYFHPF